MTKLFLSYARGDDEPFVRRLHADLVSAGFDVWFDRSDLRSRGLTFHQEIKDAIRERNRLIYVGGPKAAQSKYVGEEWRFALALDKPVIPILRLGEFESVIPGSLALLHCDDFRDNDRYPDQFAKLVANLKLPPPPLGLLFGNLPELPAHFQPRPELLRRVKDALLVDLQQPVVITGAGSRVGMQGMGGIGKSVLAAALARDQELRRSYPDGIIWVHFGKSPDLASLQREVASYLDCSEPITGLLQGKSVLRELLCDKAVLFVFDDVWQAQHVADFVELGSRCRSLITTRDAGILDTMRGALFQVQLFNEAESLQLLAESTGVTIASLPSGAREVARECGNLPLALALSAGMARKRDGRWDHVLERLRRADLEMIADRHAIEEQHRSIWVAVHASVEELDEAKRRRFAELSVFGPRGPIPSAAVQTLWAHTGDLEDLDSDELLVELRERALIWLDAALPVSPGSTMIESTWNLSLHDLLYDYTFRTAGEQGALHRDLLEAYRAKCIDGWPTGPNDGYFFDHLRVHLTAVELGGELAELLCELPWLNKKNEAGLVFDLLLDYQSAQQSLPECDGRRKILKLLDEALRRDIHFIHRHREDYPQGLFQCLWNSAWWYDCPEAEQHPRPTEKGSQIEPTKDYIAIPKLYELLEKWRATKTMQFPSQPWLRALRPPLLAPDVGIVSTCDGHRDRVRNAAFSPDGTRVVSGGFDCTVRVWDAASGLELARHSNHTENVLAVAFSPNGKRIASGSNDRTVRIWDVQARKEIFCLQGHTDNVTALKYVGDGDRLITVSLDATIRIWDTNTGQELSCWNSGESLFAIAVSGDNRFAATHNAEHRICLWDLATGTVLNQMGAMKEPLECEQSSVYALAFSPESDLIVAGGTEETVYLFDVKSGRLVDQLEFKGRWVLCAEFTSNGNQIVIGTGGFSNDGSLHVRNVNRELQRFEDQEVVIWPGDRIWSVDVSLDCARLLISGDEGKIRVWDLQLLLQQESNSHLESEGWIWHVRYSPDHLHAASASSNGTIAIWDAITKRRLRSWHGPSGQVQSYCLAFSPDSKQLIAGFSNGSLQVIDVASGRLILNCRAHDASIYSVGYTNTSGEFFSGARDGTTKLWQVVNRPEEEISSNEIIRNYFQQTQLTGDLRYCFQADESPVMFVGNCPEINGLITWSQNKILRIWSLDDGTLIEVLDEQPPPIGTNFNYPPERSQAPMGGEARLPLSDIATIWYPKFLFSKDYDVECYELVAAGGTEVCFLKLEDYWPEG